MVTSFAAQSRQDEVEIVLVLPHARDVPLDDAELRGFAAVRTVQVAAVDSLAPARAAGVRAATAPLVYLAETHAFPRPGFVEAVLAAHAGGSAAVIPAVGNANPGDGARSWSILLLDYGDRLASHPAGPRRNVAPYNAAFERDLLLGLDGDLGDLLGPTSPLGDLLRARGAAIGFHPEARVDHVNVARPRAWVAERFLGGMLLAQSRLPRWGVARRLLYAAGAPLIPFVVLTRTLRTVGWRARRRDVPPLTLPLMVVGAVIWAAGELAGYAGADADAEKRMTEYELNKLRYAMRVAV